MGIFIFYFLKINIFIWLNHEITVSRNLSGFHVFVKELL